MRKKLLVTLLALSLTAGCIAPVSLVSNQAVVAEAAKKKPKKKTPPTVKKIYKAVVAKYGDNYLANMKLSKDDIKLRYGIASSWYTDIIAEIPMMSAHVDTLIIAKAKNKAGKQKIKKQLTNYRQQLIKDTCQYPMNQLKIQASKVYVKDDYVFFIMLGSVDSKIEEGGSDEQIIEAYKKENQKAVSAINALFK
ncbi:MAG: DUF4358 domain-containing protein [Lachnospiraceae bacterium]|nr:DUF4358 domain-containing protein [Lachnospiraceae bacterium]